MFDADQTTEKVLNLFGKNTVELIIMNLCDVLKINSPETPNPENGSKQLMIENFLKQL